MTSTQGAAFLVLSESEHETIGKLWRASEGNGTPLVERYADIHSMMMGRIVERLATTYTHDPQAALQACQDQVAHAVLARAIEDNHLQGSIPGELVKCIYYKGGGREYLESFGRLCFCSAFRCKHPWPTLGHATDCDRLWEAYAHAADALLAREIEVPPLDATRLCILDATAIRVPGNCPGDAPIDLQKTVATYLSLDETAVQRVWVPICWQPLLQSMPVSSSVIATVLEELRGDLRQRQLSLFAKATVLVVDDTAAATSMTALALGLRRWMGTAPIVLGVRLKEQRWQVVDPSPRVVAREEE